MTVIRLASRRLRMPPLALAMSLAVSSLTCGQENAWPNVTNRGDPDRLGRHIQRTMTLLASSTPENRHTVRVLLYGQSITAGRWGVLLEEHLRHRFPHANLIYQRRPLSGFSTERLVKTSEADLYPFYPDLVIFHDYGNNEDYETMIRKLREQTTAEVIIQADHLRRSEKPIDESDPTVIEDRRQRWAASRNTEFLPRVAKRYGCAFDGRRELWRDYLRSHNLQPGDLVKDDVHPNDHGTYVMAELIKAYLVKRQDTRIDPMNCGYVRTYPVGEAIAIGKDSLRLEFDGNRIDVILKPDADGVCQALIDGRRPLDDPTMFYHGRNRVKWRDTPIPPGPWPAVLKMNSSNPLIAEKWTLKAVQSADDPQVYTFTLHGSQTGDDGSGRTDQRFVSHSGRVIIDPEDWDVDFAIVKLRRLEALPVEFQLDWNVETQAVNEVRAVEATPNIEPSVTVAQRLGPGKHVLELTGNVGDIQALRVYSPTKFPCPANAK